MKKQFIFMLSLAILICSLTGCFSQSINKKISNSLGISIPKDLEIEYEDTYGGFNGDGDILAKVQLQGEDSENILLGIKDNSNWNILPLSKNLKLKIYDKSDLAERLGMPEIQNGYWIFIDRFDGENKFNDDKLLLARGAANFTLGIYDTENNILYYYEYDS